MKKTILNFLPLIFIVNSCNSNNFNNISLDKNDSIESVKNNEWIIDSCGCLGLRSIEMAESLIVEYELLNKSIVDFKKVFGEPNEMQIKNDKVYLVYYFNSMCNADNKIIDGADRCWMDFVFENNLLIEIPKYYMIE